MREFQLVIATRIAEGVEFGNGKVVISWNTNEAPYIQTYDLMPAPFFAAHGIQIVWAPRLSALGALLIDLENHTHPDPINDDGSIIEISPKLHQELLMITEQSKEYHRVKRS